MSLRSLVKSEFNSTLAIFARSESPTFPPTVPALANNFSRLPYSAIHFAAVFSPTPGIDGKLSLGSPRNAAKSGYCAGVKPYFSTTASGVIRARSVTPRFGYNTVVFELISWKESRSPVQIKTSKPSASARLASVAMMSSASNPSTAKCLMPNPWTRSKRKLVCDLNSSGVADRFALYSGKRSERNVFLETSKAVAICVGFSEVIKLISIEAKP